MTETAQVQVQVLLRFLTQDAKVPLTIALSKCAALRKEGLHTPQEVALAKLEYLKPIFSDDKLAKQVHNAAKRLLNPKKRVASSALPAAPAKSLKHETHEDTERQEEAKLELPSCDLDREQLESITIETNRAPLFLAFAICVSQYVLADHPLSTRLSIAQAVTSAGAQAKAKYIGLTGSTAQDDGWADGQPKVKLMGREVDAMRRQFYTSAIKQEDLDDSRQAPIPRETFWGIDLEAMRKSNSSLVAGKMTGSAGPPIHRPESARNYLLKSIDIVETDTNLDSDGLRIKADPDVKVELKVEDDGESFNKQTVKPPTAAQIKARKEQAAGMLLAAIDMTCKSWASTITTDELDRKGSSWYMQVRPDVQDGKSGWGQRGQVKLSDILRLARDADNVYKQ